MAVRNFYVEADIDGRQTMLGGGPRNKDGGAVWMLPSTRGMRAALSEC